MTERDEATGEGTAGKVRDETTRDEVRVAVMTLAPVVVFLFSPAPIIGRDPEGWCFMGSVAALGLVAAGKLLLSRGPVRRRVCAFLFLLLNGVALAEAVNMLH